MLFFFFSIGTQIATRCQYLVIRRNSCRTKEFVSEVIHWVYFYVIYYRVKIVNTDYRIIEGADSSTQIVVVLKIVGRLLVHLHHLYQIPFSLLFFLIPKITSSINLSIKKIIYPVSLSNLFKCIFGVLAFFKTNKNM